MRAPARPESATEERARQALEARYGRALSDDEWRKYRERLLRFAQLLRTWAQRPKKE